MKDYYRTFTKELFVVLLCRCHIISQFNQGFYDIIIATDEQSLVEPAPSSSGKEKKKNGRAKAAKLVSLHEIRENM